MTDTTERQDRMAGNLRPGTRRGMRIAWPFFVGEMRPTGLARLVRPWADPAPYRADLAVPLSEVPCLHAKGRAAARSGLGRP